MRNYNITKTLNLSKEKRRDFNKLLKNSGGGSSPLILVFSKKNTYDIQKTHLQYFASIGAKLIFKDTYNTKFLTKDEVAKIANNNFIFITAYKDNFCTMCGGNARNGEVYELSNVTLNGEYIGVDDNKVMYAPAQYTLIYDEEYKDYYFTMSEPN